METDKNTIEEQTVSETGLPVADENASLTYIADENLNNFDNKINVENEDGVDEVTKKPSAEDSTTQSNSQEPTNSTKPREPPIQTNLTINRTERSPADMAKLAAFAVPKLISNSSLLFVCIILLVIVIIMRNYTTPQKKSKIDLISEEKLNALNDVSIPPVHDKYATTVEAMVTKELGNGITSKSDIDKNEMFDIVEKNGRIFKFAKERPPPRPKKQAPRLDVAALGHDSDRDGYH